MLLSILYVLAGIIFILVVKYLWSAKSRKKAANTLKGKRKDKFLEKYNNAILTDNKDLSKRALLKALEDDHDELVNLIHDTTQTSLPAWLEQEKGDFRVQYLIAMHWLARADEAKTGKNKQVVGNSPIVSFSDCVVKARSILYDVVKSKPEFLPAYAPLISVCKQKDEAWTLYNKAHQIAPTQVDYKYSMVTRLAKRYQGSDEEMFQFARESARNHPRSSLLGLIARAHIEKWVAYKMTRKVKELGLYFRQAEVVNEIKEAFKTLPQDSDKQNAPKDLLLAYNHFAFCFVCMNEKDAAKHIFGKIGVHYSNYPWSYLIDDPAEGYLEYRRRVGMGWNIN